MSYEKGKKKSSVNWIFAIIGLALIVAGIVCLVKSENFKKNAVETEATITEIEIYEDSDGDTQYNVLVEFRADDEKIEGSLGYHVSGMKKGQTVQIFYNPNDPHDFKSASEDIWLFVVFIVLGVPFLLFGFLPVIMKFITVIKNRRIQA